MSKINLKLIISIVSKHIKVAEKDININSKSNDFYRWDSLAQVNIILEIEKKTNKEISTSKMSELTSIKLILNHLK
jgi:acyl carrier protein